MNKEEPKEKENQCDATFTFSLGGPIMAGFPTVTFRCMRKKHEDGKHEYYGVSEKGWDYKVAWTEPKGAMVGMDKAFLGKESQRTM